jgi:hypothetical protein
MGCGQPGVEPDLLRAPPTRFNALPPHCSPIRGKNQLYSRDHNEMKRKSWASPKAGTVNSRDTGGSRTRKPRHDQWTVSAFPLLTLLTRRFRLRAPTQSVFSVEERKVNISHKAANCKSDPAATRGFAASSGRWAGRQQGFPLVLRARKLSPPHRDPLLAIEPGLNCGQSSERTGSSCPNGCPPPPPAGGRNIRKVNRHRRVGRPDAGSRYCLAEGRFQVYDAIDF